MDGGLEADQDMRQGVEEPLSSWGELEGELPVGLFYLGHDGRVDCDLPEALIHRCHLWKVRAMVCRKVAEDPAWCALPSRKHEDRFF